MYKNTINRQMEKETKAKRTRNADVISFGIGDIV